MKQKHKLGFASMCADRRYWQDQLKHFMEATGLTEGQVWLDCRPGGWGNVVDSGDFRGPDHATHSGATALLLGMHGDKCGGYPEKSNEELMEIHEKSIVAAKKRYPKIELWSVWSVGKSPKVVTTLKKVQELGE